MQSKEQIVATIVQAMHVCNMKCMPEGAMYWALFQRGLDSDGATSAVQYALEQKILSRLGPFFVLNDNAKEDTSGARTVCNS